MKNIELHIPKNIRDLGGIVNKDGLMVKPRCFIRSCQLADLSVDDIYTLSDRYQIKTIIDLRNVHEIEEMPDKKIPHTKYYLLPLLRGRKEGITQDKESRHMDKVPNMCELYKNMVASDFTRAQLNKTLKIIMNPKNSGVLFHCTVGKDRTGLLSLLILAMLNVDLDTIYEDFLYTNVVAQKDADDAYEYMLSKTHNEEFAKEISDIYLAHREYLDSALEYIENHYGSIMDYVIYGLHISKRKIAKFQKNFLVKVER